MTPEDHDLRCHLTFGTSVLHICLHCGRVEVLLFNCLAPTAYLYMVGMAMKGKGNWFCGFLPTHGALCYYILFKAILAKCIEVVTDIDI